jgi:hypothetical protein
MENENQKERVRIHIDREPYESPTPTTGAAVYRLGRVGSGRGLFKETDGNREDELVPNDETKVHLKQDEHFYSEKEFKIIVNARPKTVTKNRLSFDEVVALAFDDPPAGPNIMFTITYRNGPCSNPEGTLVEGQSVKIKDEMIFNVTATDKS